MNFVVLDLELTQNADSTPKIIQIGAVKMSSVTGKILSTFNEICHPGELPDSYITELTGITAEAVSAARPIESVLESFWKWYGDQQVGKVIHQWGQGDAHCLVLASKDSSVSYPQVRSFDIKQFCGPFRSAKGVSHKGGLQATMKLFDLSFTGRPHDAYNDAVATGELFVFLVKRIKLLHQLEKVLLCQNDILVK